MEGRKPSWLHTLTLPRVGWGRYVQINVEFSDSCIHKRGVAREEGVGWGIRYTSGQEICRGARLMSRYGGVNSFISFPVLFFPLSHLKMKCLVKLILFYCFLSKALSSSFSWQGLVISHTALLYCVLCRDCSWCICSCWVYLWGRRNRVRLYDVLGVERFYICCVLWQYDQLKLDIPSASLAEDKIWAKSY